MKKFFLAIFILSFAFLNGCLAPKYKHTDYVHLYTAGGWGSDSNIWIYPDDSFTVAYKSHRIETTYKGYRKYLFQSVICKIDKASAWNITTELLKADISAASERKGEAFGIMDSNNAFLEVRYGGKIFKADCYAADAYAKHFPDAHKVAEFSKIEQLIRQGTQKR